MALHSARRQKGICFVDANHHHPIQFLDSPPKLRSVGDRLNKKPRTIREHLPKIDGDTNVDDDVTSFGLFRSADREKLRRRALRYLDMVMSTSGTRHLSDADVVRLTSVRDGLPIAKIPSEQDVNEIAAALYEEMPWMSRDTEIVWHGLRASARNCPPGLRFNPLILAGAPGIGKNFWARRLAHYLTVPTTMIEATGEAAAFVLVGTQRGWGSAAPGKLMQAVLQHRHAGPLVIVDEVEKAGQVESTKGVRYSLADALLPLLERMTAETCQCPYFQVQFNMSWTNWVMTANSRRGLPDPLQSRCIILDLLDLTPDQLLDFALKEGSRRQLPRPAVEAVVDVFRLGDVAAGNLNLRLVSRMLDRADALACQPALH